MVICNSSRFGVVEQSWDEFQEGQDVKLEGYPGSFPYYEVLRRARSFIGRPYNLIQFNCDHFVNDAHGLPVASDQMKRTLAIATLAGFPIVASMR
jgi:hypothetical protein